MNALDAASDNPVTSRISRDRMTDVDESRVAGGSRTVLGARDTSEKNVRGDAAG